MDREKLARLDITSVEEPYCRNCGKSILDLAINVNIYGYPGQTPPRYCDECFDKIFPNFYRRQT